MFGRTEAYAGGPNEQPTETSHLDELIADFGSGVGIWAKMNNTSWVKQHFLSAESMVTGNLDGN
jgi:hypothetical protein